jgi:hypothetical protein
MSTFKKKIPDTLATNDPEIRASVSQNLLPSVTPSVGDGDRYALLQVILGIAAVTIGLAGLLVGDGILIRLRRAVNAGSLEGPKPF